MRKTLLMASIAFIAFVSGHRPAAAAVFSGQVTFLRFNDFNDVYGPPGDSMNAEVFFSVSGAPGRVFGLTLRNDSQMLPHTAAVQLLRDSFIYGYTLCTEADTSLPGVNKLVSLGRIWFKSGGC
ncbi:MAG: hypothetical protein IT370_27405 [Deltaproteobacteria bacterium]|nr:hypothetical protein [Deltaproteobacteria bacterium]